MPRKWWVRLGFALGLLSVLGVAWAGYVVSEQGWEGLWERKRGFIEGRNPEFGPALDHLEEAARGRGRPLTR